MEQDWSEHAVRVAGLNLHVVRGGKGPTLLILHHETGTPDRLPFYDQLAERFTLVIPHHPGWGKSERPAWARHVRDLAALHQWLLAELDVPHCALLGLGFGGWLADEMASLSPRQFSHLILVGAMGIKPPQGDILDQAVMSYIAYPQAGFHDEAAFKQVYGDVSTDQLEAWDIAREMCFRTAWKPYMYNPALPHLLGGIRSRSMIVWGSDDRIVPISAAEAFAASLPGARRETIPACGHFVEMEKPAELARLVTSFLTSG